MTKEITPTEEVEEVSPIELIEALSEDLTITLKALRRIAQISPAHMPGGPNNRHFGKRFQAAFEKARKEALEAIEKVST